MSNVGSLGFGNAERLTSEEIASLGLEDKKAGDPDRVKEAISMDSYIENNYHVNASKAGNCKKEQLKQIGKDYGAIVHEIRGNGNCLATAFATALIYIISKNEPSREVLVDKLTNQMREETRRELQDQIQEIIGSIYGLEDNNESRNSLLLNNSYMDSFAKVIRLLANDLAKNQMTDYADEIASRNDGVEMSIMSCEMLSKFLGPEFTSHAIELRNSEDGYKVHQSNNDSSPNIVLIFKGGHFITVACNVYNFPEKRKIENKIFKVFSNSSLSNSEKRPAPVEDIPLKLLEKMLRDDDPTSVAEDYNANMREDEALDLAKQLSLGEAEKRSQIAPSSLSNSGKLEKRPAPVGDISLKSLEEILGGDEPISVAEDYNANMREDEALEFAKQQSLSEAEKRSQIAPYNSCSNKKVAVIAVSVFLAFALMYFNVTNSIS